MRGYPDDQELERERQRLQKARLIFEKSLQLDGGDRRRYIEEASADDVDLKLQVRALLEAHCEPEHMLDQSPLYALAGECTALWCGTYKDGSPENVERLLRAHGNNPDWLNGPALGTEVASFEGAKLEGRTLSGYTLIREVGRGGMGCVFLAERSDQTFHRKVAIKLILPPAGSADVIARFRQECQILASLDHSNIAKLHDAGMTEEGWPYFVMEFVEGLPIHRWCDERKLNTSQRVELLRGVLDAVRYAHQHLIVHRDLKPGSILVTGDGVVKLLDFGIAKVLSTTTSGEAADNLTLASMMTPGYASPEQVNGTPITTQSDVYSLGVVLYELLTGHKPYRLLSAALPELARVIVEVEPTRPSDVVITSTPPSGRDRIQLTPENVSSTREGDAIRLRQRLHGDLDAILLMALRKEPERRYSSVESRSP